MKEGQRWYGLKLMHLSGQLAKVTDGDAESLPGVDNCPVCCDSVFANAKDASKMFMWARCGNLDEGGSQGYFCQVS